MHISQVHKSLSSYKMSWIEDDVVQCGQGPIADRAHEHLGRIDVGVILLRKIWQRELRKLSSGQRLKEWTEPATGVADESHQPVGSLLAAN